MCGAEQQAESESGLDREDVKAEVRAAVKRVLRTRSVRTEDFDLLFTKIMAQAEALYAEWPVAA